ncbi:uncharacterized protein LOC142181618 [Nicotiana tabacum]|uniref:Uncharacterized protein LOC142181618 n=1 Tax=Nicotiana tabacum TaxID=4097 RepID=A0AC58UN20_TOBAC
MVKQRGRGAKQPGRRVDPSWGGKAKLKKLTPQSKLKTRKQVVCDEEQSGSKYLPSHDVSTDLGKAPAGPANAPTVIQLESSEGSEAGSAKYSTSPTTSESREGAEDKNKSDEEVPDSRVLRVGGIERTRNLVVWQDKFICEVAFHKFREVWPKKKVILETSIVTRDLLPYLPRVHEQFLTRVGWDFFKDELVNANEHMVKEFYSNVAHTKEGSIATKVRDKKIVFSGKPLNEYLGFNDEDDSQYREKLALKEEAHPWVAQSLAQPGTILEWIQVGKKILRKDLNFEMRGWLTFVKNGLDPSSHDQTIPIARAVLIASIMAGFPINVWNVMYSVITSIGIDTDRNYPYPNTLTMYFEDEKVKKYPFNVGVSPVSPFSWFNIQGSDNPKGDKKGKASTSAPTGQSEEAVAVEASIEPPTPAATTVLDIPSSSAGPSSSTGPVVPTSKSNPLTTQQLAKTLASLNKWMSVSTSKLSTLATTVVAQSVPATVEISPSIEETLKTLLANQEKILATQAALTKAVDAQGKALKELARKHKKMRKSTASKKEVKELRAEVDKLKADQLPLDLFCDESAPPPAVVVQEPQQEEEPRHPRKKRKLSSTKGVVIEVAQV